MNDGWRAGPNHSTASAAIQPGLHPSRNGVSGTHADQVMPFDYHSYFWWASQCNWWYGQQQSENASFTRVDRILIVLNLDSHAVIMEQCCCLLGTQKNWNQCCLSSDCLVCWVGWDGEQRQFSELLVKAAGDYGALSAATVDIQWSHSFKDPPAIWGVHTPTLLASKPLFDTTLFYCPLCYLLQLCFHRKFILRTSQSYSKRHVSLWLCRSCWGQFQQHLQHAHAIMKHCQLCVMQWQLCTRHVYSVRPHLPLHLPKMAQIMVVLNVSLLPHGKHLSKSQAQMMYWFVVTGSYRWIPKIGGWLCQPQVHSLSNFWKAWSQGVCPGLRHLVVLVQCSVWSVEQVRMCLVSALIKIADALPVYCCLW